MEEFDRFVAEARTVLSESEQAMKKLDHPIIGTGHLLIGLGKNTVIAARFNRMGVDPNRFEEELDSLAQEGKLEAEDIRYSLTRELKEVIEETGLVAARRRADIVTAEDMTTAMIYHPNNNGRQVLERVRPAGSVSLQEAWNVTRTS